MRPGRASFILCMHTCVVYSLFSLASLGLFLFVCESGRSGIIIAAFEAQLGSLFMVEV